MNESNLRILHTAALLSPPSGIKNQMTWEQIAATKMQLDWQTKIYCPTHSTEYSSIINFDKIIDSHNIKTRLQKFLAWIRLRRNYHNWLLSQQNSVDIYILRYYVHDPFQLWFIKKCKKPVYFIHHTLEIPELAMPKGISAIIRSNLEKFFGKLTLPKTAGVIGVTDEIIQHEIYRANLKDKTTHIYPNGITYNSNQLTDCRSDDTPEFLFVSNFAPWHGLDILLNSIKQNPAEFILHLVGEIPKELLELTSDSRIVVHGNLKHEQIFELSKKCWVGFSTFALSRKNMKQACPLKTREYLMLGLSVYGDSADTFPPDTPYFKNGNADISEIINFAKTTRNLKKSDVSNQAREFIDKEKLLKLLNKYITENTKKTNEKH